MKKQLTILLFPLLTLFLFLEVSNVYAVGALFSRPRFSQQVYQKMWIKSINTDIDITEQIAVTHLDQVFFNELNTSVEAIFIFPLPENATITELVYWVNGQRFIAEIRERQQAVNAYNEKLRQWLDPALLEYLGDNLFRLSIVPINALSEVRTEITYIEPLKYDFGKVDYKFQLNTLGLSSKSLEKVTVQLNANSKYPYKSFKSPSHVSSTALKINKINDNNYTLFYGDENFYPDKDLFVEYETERKDVEYKILTYTPSVQDSIGDDSFYALWITSPDIIDDSKIIPQNIVFTADVSSSMEGKRLQQVKETMNNFIDLLNPQDNFNIITFGTFVEKFKPDLIEASETNKQLAKSYVQKLYALGLTNIDDALTASLNQSFNSQTHNSLIFLTDGEPTWGVLNQDSIVNHTKTNNVMGVRIFSFGVGENISKNLLNNVSFENHAYATFITNEDSIALVVNNLFKRISKPVLTDIAVDLGGLDSWDFYPKNVTDLFWGSQILYLGKYKGSGTYKIGFNGKISGGEFNFSDYINFPDTIGGHKFVPRLWAREKINDILELIEVYGETPELVGQIISLSLMFQILTPYTAFYSDPTPTKVSDETQLVNSFNLMQNYPNPFNPSTTIVYQLPAGKNTYSVVLKIYNALGELVRVLVNTEKPAGLYSVVWNGKDMKGFDVPSGIYFYSLEAGNTRVSKKMMLVR